MRHHRNDHHKDDQQHQQHIDQRSHIDLSGKPPLPEFVENAIAIISQFRNWVSEHSLYQTPRTTKKLRAADPYRSHRP